MQLLKLIEDLSNEGCTDIEAIEIATDLIKIDMLRQRFRDSLDQIKLDNVIIAAKQANKEHKKLPLILSILSKRERECFLMHHIGLKSMGNIAIELNISKSSVQQYIIRARKKIQSYTAEWIA